MVQRIACVLIRCSGKFLLASLGLALTFAVVAGLQSEGAVSCHSFRAGLHATLALLMLMEPPRTVLQHPQLPMVIFGWLICVVGWLLMPLLIGAMVDVTMASKESEAELRLRLYRYFRDCGVPREQLDMSVEEAVGGISKITRKG